MLTKGSMLLTEGSIQRRGGTHRSTCEGEKRSRWNAKIASNTGEEWVKTKERFLINHGRGMGRVVASRPQRM